MSGRHHIPGMLLRAWSLQLGIKYVPPKHTEGPVLQSAFCWISSSCFCVLLEYKAGKPGKFIYSHLLKKKNQTTEKQHMQQMRRFWTLSWHPGAAWRAQAMEVLKSSAKALLLLGRAQNPTAMTCGITTRHSPASNSVTCQLQVCQCIKWCLSNTSQVFWYRPPRAGHDITPGRSTNRTFLPQSALEHISISLAPTPRFKHLRSAPLMIVLFSAA